MAAIESSVSRLVHVQNPPPAEEPVQQDTTPVVDTASTQPTSQPLTAEQARVDAALAQLEAAQDAKAAVKNPGHYPFLQEDIDTARQNLKAAIEAELAARAAQLPQGQTPDDAMLKQWGDEIIARYAQNPAQQAAVRDALGTIGTARQTLKDPSIVPTPTGDPAKDLKALGEAFAKAPPDVQQKMLQDPATREIVERAAAWASEPLNNAMQPYNNQGQYMQGAVDAAKRLDEATAGLPPELAQQVVNKAMPTFEKFSKDYEKKFGNEDSPWRVDGTTSLLNTSLRVAGTPESDALLKVAAPSGVMDSQMVQGIQQAAKQDIEAYAKEMEELNWLIKSLGPAVPPEKLQKALDDYRAAKGPEWQKKIEGLQNSIAARGNALLALSIQQGKLPPGERNPALSAELAKALSSPEGQTAVIAAMKQNPQVAAGDNGLALKEFFASIKLGDSARKLAGEFVNLYVRANVAEAVGGINPNNPASFTRAQEAIDGLKGSGMAKLLGVTDDELNKAIDALKKSMPAAGETPQQLEAKLSKLNSDLEGIKGFNSGTYQGQLFRSLGVLGAGFSTANAVNRFGNDPSVANAFAAFATSGGLVKSVADTFKVFGKAPEGSASAFITKTGPSLALGLFAAAGDAALAADALIRKNDPVAAAMYGTAAVGGAMAAVGAAVNSAWLGPVGIALVVAGTIGGIVWENAKDANKFEGGESSGPRAVFFEAAGFDKEAAKVLADNSGDGNNVVPFLIKYGEQHGLSREETVKWVNEMPPEKLAMLRDTLHRTADELEGKVGDFGTTASNDAAVIKRLNDLPLSATSMALTSATQVDALLGILGITRPGAPLGSSNAGGGGGGGVPKFT